MLATQRLFWLFAACLFLAGFRCAAETEQASSRTVRKSLGLNLLAKQHPVYVVSKQHRQLFIGKVVGKVVGSVKKAVKTVGKKAVGAVKKHASKVVKDVKKAAKGAGKLAGKVAKNKWVKGAVKAAKKAGKLAGKVANNKWVKRGIMVAGVVGAIGCTVASGGLCAAALLKAKAVAAKTKAGAAALKVATVVSKGYKVYKQGKEVFDTAKTVINTGKSAYQAGKACAKSRDRACLGKIKDTVSHGSQLVQSRLGTKGLDKLGNTKFGSQVIGFVNKNKGKIDKARNGINQAKGTIETAKACAKSRDRACLEKLKNTGSQLAQTKLGKNGLGKLSKTKLGSKAAVLYNNNKDKIDKARNGINGIKQVRDTINACKGSLDANCLSQMKSTGALAKQARSRWSSGARGGRPGKNGAARVKTRNTGRGRSGSSRGGVKPRGGSSKGGVKPRRPRGAGSKGGVKPRRPRGAGSKGGKKAASGRGSSSSRGRGGSTASGSTSSASTPAAMVQAMRRQPPAGSLNPPAGSATAAGGSDPNAGTLPSPGISQRVNQLMSQNGVNSKQVRKVFGYVRDTYQDGRQSLTNAVAQVKVTIEDKAASLASKGVDKITSNAWVARQLQRFNIDPKPFNDMASNAVRKAVGYGLEKLQDAAMNTAAGRKMSLIDSGIQGSLSMGSEVLGCDGANGCAGVHGLRVLQSSGGRLDLYFNAEFSPDAINAAAKGSGLSYSRDQIAAAVTAALADPALVQRAINEAALESSEPSLRQDLGTCQVTSALVTQPTFFQTPIIGWNTFMAPVMSTPPTPQPSTISAYFVPCKINCPTGKATVPQCGFYQTCGNGCFCGTRPGVPSLFPTRQPTNNMFTTLFSQPTMEPVWANPSTASAPRRVSPAPTTRRLRTSSPSGAPAPVAVASGGGGGSSLGGSAVAATPSPTPGRPTFQPSQSTGGGAGGGELGGPTQAPQGDQAGVSSTGGDASVKGAGGLDYGTIAGVVVGCVVLVALILVGVFYCSQNKVKRLTPVDNLKAMYASNTFKDHGPGHGQGQGQSYGYNGKAAQVSARGSVAMANRGRASAISPPSSRGSDFDHSSIYAGRQSAHKASFQPYVASHLHRDSGAWRPSGMGLAVVGSTVSRREY